MASAEEIAKLRSLLGDPEQLTNLQLNSILDSSVGDINQAAAEGWGIIAASYTSLVNVSESGSTRSLGDLYKNAMAMKTHYDNLGVGGGSTTAAGRTRIGRIVRSS